MPSTPAPRLSILQHAAIRPLTRVDRQRAVLLAARAAAHGEPDLSRGLYLLARTAPRDPGERRQARSPGL
jgi:hypothetical protein